MAYNSINQALFRVFRVFELDAQVLDAQACQSKKLDLARVQHS